MRSLLFVFGMLAVGCVSSEPGEEELVSTAESALGEAGLIVYRNGVPVPEAELSPLDPTAFGATIVEGAEWKGRIDLLENGLIGGVFQAAQGSFSIVYPGVVHSTIHLGQAIITDETGSHVFNAGDSFLVTKGTEILWEIQGEKVQASFLGNFLSPHAPGPLVIYPNGGVASDAELSLLGDPAAFDMTVLEGDLAMSARTDYLQGPEFAGVFQATDGTASVGGSVVTEHGTILRHGITFTDAGGAAHQLHQGDSFLIKAGSGYTFDIEGPNAQESFFAVFAP